jgi:transcriptional regulator with XRE-family HTH domain
MGRASIHRPQHLSGKLTAIRHALGLSQNQMIDRLGLSGKLTQAEISAFELGKRVPLLIVLLRYARVHNVPVENLIDDEINVDG